MGKKILQINVTANWGSTGRIAEQINEKANQHDWQTAIAFGRNQKPSKSLLIKVGNQWSVYEHYIENRIVDNEGLASRLATRKLIGFIKNYHPDIIHLHNIHDHWLNYRILFDYLNSTTIPVVWTFHDFWAITGHCAHFYPYDCQKWKQECIQCPANKGLLPLIDRSCRNFNLKKKLFLDNENLHIVCVSDWVGNNVRQSFLKEKDIRVIPNGIDITLFQPTFDSKNKTLTQLEGKFIILSVASQWKVGKGLNDYIAMSRVLKNDELIVLIGISDSIRKKLPDNVLGISLTTSQKELAEWYTRAGVITSFSSAETFGLTIVEAFACGTPAVVYDNTAPPSLITSETGMVVPDKDWRAAYESIQEIKSKGKHGFSSACRKQAEQFFDKEKCFEQYIRLYEDLLNSSSKQ